MGWPAGGQCLHLAGSKLGLVEGGPQNLKEILSTAGKQNAFRRICLNDQINVESLSVFFGAPIPGPKKLQNNSHHN